MAEARPLTQATIAEIARLAGLMATARVRRFANEHRDVLGSTNNETEWSTKRRVKATRTAFIEYLMGVRVEPTASVISDAQLMETADAFSNEFGLEAKHTLEFARAVLELNAAPVEKAWPAPTPLTTLCRICGGQQFDTPSGVTCPMGHGGDEGVPA